MKRTIDLKKKFLAHSLAAILLSSVLLVSAASAESDTVVRTADGVSYISGGIGDESIGHLNSLAGEFNLKLVFALKSGGFLSDVGVVITDAKGKTVLDTTSEGPWLLTRLPAGNYQVVASFEGKSEKQKVSVDAKNLRTADFHWVAQ